MVLTLLTNSLVAYAIARNMHRPFFKGLYFYFLAAIFVPFPIIMLPVVKETALLGLDNPVGLILLYTVYGLSFNIFIFMAYINSIPVSWRRPRGWTARAPGGCSGRSSSRCCRR